MQRFKSGEQVMLVHEVEIRGFEGTIGDDYVVDKYEHCGCLILQGLAFHFDDKKFEKLNRPIVPTIENAVEKEKLMEALLQLWMVPMRSGFTIPNQMLNTGQPVGGTVISFDVFQKEVFDLMNKLELGTEFVKKYFTKS